jgi:hypothetical protein
MTQGRRRVRCVNWGEKRDEGVFEEEEGREGMEEHVMFLCFEGE